MVMAGFKWHPEMWPMANAMVITVSPNASATPTNPMPNCGNAAAKTAAPQPPKTSQNVPRNSALIRFINDICIFLPPRRPIIAHIAAIGLRFFKRLRFDGRADTVLEYSEGNKPRAAATPARLLCRPLKPRAGTTPANQEIESDRKITQIHARGGACLRL